MTLVHVDDCAEAAVRLAASGRPGQEMIVAGQVVTFRGWMEALARVSGRPAPRVWLPDFALAPARLAGALHPLLREGLGMGLDWAFTAEKARAALGWSPRPLDDGLASVVAWHRSR
jgi:nucleoside-diphosphate-sugar epimerase